MTLLLALLAGVLFAAGVYLVLSRHLLRVVFGLVLLSNAVNLVVFGAGRVARAAPPLVPPGAAALEGAYANPLPQALVLTAIVIGFGLVAFALALVYRTYASLGAVETDALGPEFVAEPGPDAAVPDAPSVNGSPSPARTPA